MGNSPRELLLAEPIKIGQLELENRIVKSVSLRQETSRKQLLAVAENLLPDGQPQERLLNVVPFLVKFGPSFIQQVKNQVDLCQTRTQIVMLK